MMVTKFLLGITVDRLFVTFTNKSLLIYYFDIPFLGSRLSSVSTDRNTHFIVVKLPSHRTLIRVLSLHVISLGCFRWCNMLIS